MSTTWSYPSATRVMQERPRLVELARRLVQDEGDVQLLVRCALSVACRQRFRWTEGDVAACTRTILCRSLFAAWCCRSVPGAETILEPGDVPARRRAPPAHAGRLIRFDTFARGTRRPALGGPRRIDELRTILADTPA